MEFQPLRFPRPAPAAAPDVIVDVSNLWRSYAGRWGRKVHALKGVDLQVRTGEIFGLLGPNGAGKTTTLKTILGLLHPSRGRVSLFGRPVTDAATRRKLGFLTEHPYFYDYLTGREFLDLCGVLCGLPAATRRLRAFELLEKLDLQSAADTRLRKYSKGMLQRLGLAQALIHSPSLVILDEPMSGLDPLGRGLVRDMILSLKQEGVTVLFSSHILPDVETLCDRVAILAGGSVVACAPMADLSAEADPGFEIVAQGLDPAYVAILEARGGIMRAAGPRTIIEAPDRAAMNFIVGELLGSGAELMGVSPRRSPLEAHFMRAVAGAGARGIEAADEGPPLLARTGTDP